MPEATRIQVPARIRVTFRIQVPTRIQVEAVARTREGSLLVVLPLAGPVARSAAMERDPTSRVLAVGPSSAELALGPAPEMAPRRAGKAAVPRRVPVA